MAALVATLFLTQIAWGNLTGFGIGEFPLLYDDVALLRLAVAVTGTAIAWSLISLGLSGRHGEQRRIIVDPTWAALGLLAVWAVVSAVLSQQGSTVWLGQSERLEGVVTIALYALLFGAGLQVGASSKALKPLSVAFVVGSAVLAFHGVLQMLGLDPSNHSLAGYGFGARSAFASLANPNFLGGHLALALPVAVALTWRRTQTPAARITLAVATLLIVVALLGSASQGAWIAVAVQGALAAALYLRSRGAGRRALAGAIGVLLAGVLAVGAVSALVPGLGQSISQTAQARVMLSRIAIDAAAARPLIGYGPDAYLSAFREHRDQSYREFAGSWSTNNNAHSWLPQYAATLGVPGAALLLAALAFGLWRSRPRGARSQPDDLLRTAAWLGLIGYTAHLQGSVAMIASTVPFWLLMGVLCAPRARRVALPHAATMGLTALAAIVLTASVIGAGRAVAADRTYLRSRFAYNGLASGDPADLAAEAAALNPLSVKYARGHAQALAKHAFEAEGDPRAVRTRVAAARQAYARVLTRWPRDYAAHAWLVGLEAWAAEQLPDDDDLRASTRRTAKAAAALDRLHWEVAPLRTGSPSQAAIQAALSVQGAP